jgi:hypothetical protein
MAQNFIACDREQSFLMPPDVRDWLPEGHFAWFVLDAVEELDLDSFYEVYRPDGMGRPAYDPRMMAHRSDHDVERFLDRTLGFGRSVLLTLTLPGRRLGNQIHARAPAGAGRAV